MAIATGEAEAGPVRMEFHRHPGEPFQIIGFNVTNRSLSNAGATAPADRSVSRRDRSVRPDASAAGTDASAGLAQRGGGC